jgi:AraC-like DNA-binding protein
MLFLQLMHESFTLTESLSAEQPLQLLIETIRSVPGSVHFTIKRYLKPIDWLADDAGMLKYHYEASEPDNNKLELKFCLSGNMYCSDLPENCNKCRLQSESGCKEKLESIDLLNFTFSSTLLAQLVNSRLKESSSNDSALSFNYSTSFSKTLPLCSRIRLVLESFLNHTYTDVRENIFINAQTQMLLLYCMDCMLGEKEINTISCKFLANEEDREKIIKARDILLQHIGEPITIKELSRKIAMNECYLKKGFKELFGTTIFEFYQSQRMEHAKYLLYEKGSSVTDVSFMLGYSSISHFSTAFKKHTGLKPCELLFRQF